MWLQLAQCSKQQSEFAYITQNLHNNFRMLLTSELITVFVTKTKKEMGICSQLFLSGFVINSSFG